MFDDKTVLIGNSSKLFSERNLANLSAAIIDPNVSDEKILLFLDQLIGAGSGEMEGPTFTKCYIECKELLRQYRSALFEKIINDPYRQQFISNESLGRKIQTSKMSINPHEQGIGYLGC